MTGKVLDAFIQNHENDLADFEVVLDAKHQPEKRALGLFGKKHGGFVQREKGDKPLVADTNGDLLVAYAKPIGEDSVETIEQGRFQHASMEFHPDYRSNVEQTYLSDDLREIDNDDVQPGGPGSGKRKFGSGLKKVAKGGLKKYGKGYAGGLKKAAKAYGRGMVGGLENINTNIKLNSLISIYDELPDYVEQGQDNEFFWFDKNLFDFSEAELPIEEGFYKVDKQTAEEMLAVLDEMAQDKDYLHLFEEETMAEETEELQSKIEVLQAQLQNAQERTIKLEKQSLQSQVRTLVLELQNLRDNGYGYTAETLNLVQALMLGEDIEGDETIKLENATDPGDVANYYRRGMVKFLKSAIVRAPMEAKTQPQEIRALELGTNGNERYEAGKCEAKTFWSAL